jgi:hypothetical protein
MQRAMAREDARHRPDRTSWLSRGSVVSRHAITGVWRRAIARPLQRFVGQRRFAPPTAARPRKTSELDGPTDCDSAAASRAQRGEAVRLNSHNQFHHCHGQNDAGLAAKPEIYDMEYLCNLNLAAVTEYKL